MDKPIIGISGSRIIDQHGPFPGYNRSYVNDDYIDSVIQNGGIPYIIPFNEDVTVTIAQFANVDGLILSGGHDIDPRLYGEESLPKIGEIWPARDAFDMLLLKEAEKQQKPVLGICRGAQLINVAHGGSLYQDQSYRQELTFKHNQGYAPDLETQSVTLEEGSYLASLFGKKHLSVNTFHHQLIKEVGKDLRSVAYAKDGVIEALENSDKSIIGVQWHPEMLHRSDPAMNKVFIDLINKSTKEG
ncbi:gamma-glutamyl-gamma-aminobutyrate hydrolase family protein [Limosilactobacillus agrestis]|uniref:gamma-glutamyl-gamma-aminobutyrate hydrolase family protein n=1 Tax=Limosilactobacillus agrestis TaxID=2759748 RepID=UPI001E57051F|nr:gamma-glutamyl-gamma-aminobutyrate hydrolase family protein [Limosilactobacillus agrestis]MCD7113005.1 gamma-glutamyl-gamma-aminobutyrate hydrolase family protein [Limosilactobacillus agrestis]